MSYYHIEDFFEEDVLKPLRKRIAIRYMEFPGNESPVVFVRLAAITQLAKGPVFCRLHAPIIEGQATRSWDLGYVYTPVPNWEKAAELLCESGHWEKFHREWHEAQRERKETNKLDELVLACRADRPFVANPALGESPKFTPIDSDDQMFRYKMYALLHMIPCHLETAGYYTFSSGHHKAEMVRKLEERLSGYLRKANKT